MNDTTRIREARLPRMRHTDVCPQHRIRLTVRNFAIALPWVKRVGMVERALRGLTYVQRPSTGNVVVFDLQVPALDLEAAMATVRSREPMIRRQSVSVPCIELELLP